MEQILRYWYSNVVHFHEISFIYLSEYNIHHLLFNANKPIKFNERILESLILLFVDLVDSFIAVAMLRML